MKNPLRIIFVTLFAIVFSGVKAQLNYKPGRIVTNSNDTIIGLISDRGDLRNSKNCLYKENKKSKSIKYSPQDIKSYLFLGEKNYHSHSIYIKDKLTPVFFEVLLEGKINLLHPRIGGYYPYYLSFENGDLIRLSRETAEIQKKVNGALASYQNPVRIQFNQFRDTLNKVFNNNNIIICDIPYLEYTDKALQTLVANYITLTCKGENCITYEKDLKAYKPTYGFFTGIQFSQIKMLDNWLKDALVPENDISVPIGFLYNKPLKLISYRLSIQTEFQVSKLSYNIFIPYKPIYYAYQKLTSTVFSIPLYLKYGIKMKKFTPSMGVGKEIGFVLTSNLPYAQFDIAEPESHYSIKNWQIHWQQKGGWFFDLGLTYQIHPKYSLFTSFRLQTQRNLIINDGNAKHYTYSKAKKEGLGKEYSTDMLSLRFGICF